MHGDFTVCTGSGSALPIAIMMPFMGSLHGLDIYSIVLKRLDSVLPI